MPRTAVASAVNFRAVWGPATAPCLGDAVNLAHRDARVLLQVLGYDRRAAICGDEEPGRFAERLRSAHTTLSRARQDPAVEMAFGSVTTRWRARLAELEQVAAQAARERGKVQWR